MLPLAVPAAVIPAVEPMPSGPPELSVNVPGPVRAALPVMLKVAPLDTVQFLVAARAMLNPPLLNVPLCTLRLPVTLVAVMAALIVAPPALVLLTVRLLLVTALTPMGMVCADVPLKLIVLVVPGMSVPRVVTVKLPARFSVAAPPLR